MCCLIINGASDSWPLILKTLGNSAVWTFCWRPSNLFLATRVCYSFTLSSLLSLSPALPFLVLLEILKRRLRNGLTNLQNKKMLKKKQLCIVLGIIIRLLCIKLSVQILTPSSKNASFLLISANKKGLMYTFWKYIYNLMYIAKASLVSSLLTLSCCYSRYQNLFRSNF